MVYPRLLAVVVGLLAVVAVPAGCTAIGIGVCDDPDPEELFEAAFVHDDDLEVVHGERTTAVSGGNDTRTERIEVTERPYVTYRSEVLDSDVPQREGTQYVSNATGSWSYDPSADVVTAYEADAPYENDAVREARAQQAERQLEYYDLTYRGTRTIVDREAHVLDIEAKPETAETGISLFIGDSELILYAVETVDPAEELTVVEQTVWIDAEYRYPLQERLVVEGPTGDRYEMTERFETVTFNTAIEDDRFVFDPPANATVQEWE